MKKSITKEQLEDLYCYKQYSIEEISKIIHICSENTTKLVHQYGLTRDNKSIRIEKMKKTKWAKSPLKQISDTISKEELIKWYVEDDGNYKDAPAHFGITKNQFESLCRYYGIKKSRRNARYKSIKTCKEKYGKDWCNSSKAKRTLIKKYGSLENYYKIRQEKADKTNLERYGYKFKKTYELRNIHNELYQQVWGNKEQSINYLKTFKIKPTVVELSQAFNCSINSVHLWVEKFKLNTYIRNIKTCYEESILMWLQSLNIEHILQNDRTLLKTLELDFYLPEYKLAIEFNGNYWHSSGHKDKYYHFNKSYLCEQQGVRLIHIYQYQWDDLNKQNILKSIILNALGKNTNIIYARKCKIKELKTKDVEMFSNLNSLHGHRNARVYLGLFYNDELVELMSFGKAFFASKEQFDYECIRSITKCNTTVVGGMNKLFNYFVKKYTPNSILYYVDYNTHNGSSMDKLGFKFKSYSKFGLMNIANSKDVQDKYGFCFNRQPKNYKVIKELINEGKVLELYTAGVKKYVWDKES